MFFYRSDNHYAPFNIASEEYFFKHFEEDFFILYQNEPSIVIGKHQNALAEVNPLAVWGQGLPVVRRFSGGGAVFHDMGNLNFCFVSRGTKERLVNFERFTSPILEALKDLGVNARFEGRNSLTINGKKFSGNASHVYKDRVMHHGTLLFSANLSRLNEVLRQNPTKFTDKGVRSVKSAVTNISEHFVSPLSLDVFSEQVLFYVQKMFPAIRKFKLQNKDLAEIEELVATKYDTREWNFGYSPKYGFRNSVRISNGGILEAVFSVEKGYINKAKFISNSLKNEELEDIKDIFLGCPHHPEFIESKLDYKFFKKYFKNVTRNELLDCMF